MSRSSQRTLLALLTITIVAVAAVVMADSTTNNDYMQAYDQNGNMVLLPKVRIINWGNTVAQFDSTSGAIHVFKGRLDRYSANGSWVQAVPPVSGASGPLQIQNPVGPENHGATFLVDTVSGRTWLMQLASRAHAESGNGSWVEIRKLR